MRKEDEEHSWLIRPQPRLGQGGLVTLIVLTSILIPFSMDIYTPAVPALPAYFDTHEGAVNLTIVLFFLFMTISMLLFGPVSDRFGRKPVLVGGLAVYVAGSIMCSIAWRIGLLIGFRILQAIGAGAVSSVSMALVKDCFIAKRREQLLAIIQVLMVIGPVAAPLFGGIILAFADWRAVFVFLTVLGVLCLACSLLFAESLPVTQRTSPGIGRTLSGLATVGRNPSFAILLLVVAFLNVGFCAYLVSAPYIYENMFGCTPQQYTYFFAGSAAITTIGPVGWIAASKHVTPRTFTSIAVVACIGAGAALLCVGMSSALVFCACFTVFATFMSAMRPYTTNILLAQQERDTGSASSLINFTCSIFGVLGMGLAMLPWPSYLVGLSICIIGCSSLALLAWAVLLRSRHVRIKEFER